MDHLPKLINGLQESNKMKRCAAYKKLYEFVQSEEGNISQESGLDIIHRCLKGFEDGSERCREEAVLITTHLMRRQGPSILDWILPSVVTRIGVSPVAEESEEIRLLLLQLASLCMECFPHDIGPRNYIDFFQVLLENCFEDTYPDLKKEACKVACRLCSIEPQQVKLISVPLARSVKKNGLLHKHSAVRCESVSTLAVLFRHGASEVLADGKDEPESKTTASQLFILANDHSEQVRFAVLSVLSCALLDIKERLDMHSKYLPHLLLLSTDSFEKVRSEAIRILEKLGKLYMLDNEDNNIDISKRRVTMKDIEWYGDEEYPNMKDLTYSEPYPILHDRPTLGTRYAVAEATRAFLEKITADISAIDWVIPFSTNNKKAVALRILWNIIFHCEKSIVQFTERILAALYKVLRDESEDVRNEATLCVEILGRFLTPDQYLPFLISKPLTNVEEDTTIIQKSASKTVILSSLEEDTRGVPTLFSTAAATTKCSILIALGHLVKGSQHQLTPQHATRIVQALTCNELLDSESEDIVLSLLVALSTLFGVFGDRHFLPSPERPLPVEVQNDPKQRTLDSILLYALIRIKCSPVPTAKAKTTKCIADLSMLVTGSPNGIYSLHIHRILLRHGPTMPVAAFADLVLSATERSDLGTQLKGVFLSKLGSIDFSMRVTDDLQYLTILERILWSQDIAFSEIDLEELLRIVVLPLSAFHPGNVAHLFRKVAINCLCALTGDFYFSRLKALLEANDFALATKVLTIWCSASDSEDGEMRLVCMTAFADVSKLPMTPGCANEVVQSVLLRFDDSSDTIRHRTVSGLNTILKACDATNPVLLKEIDAQMVPIVKKSLVYLDDEEDTMGIRAVLQDVLKKLGDISPNIVADLVQSSQSKHQDPQSCEEILKHITSKHS